MDKGCTIHDYLPVMSSAFILKSSPLLLSYSIKECNDCNFSWAVDTDWEPMACTVIDVTYALFFNVATFCIWSARWHYRNAHKYDLATMGMTRKGQRNLVFNGFFKEFRVMSQ